MFSRRAPAPAQSVEEIAGRLIHLALRPYGDQPWWEGANLWEPAVQIALRDLCRPGSTVFDVGANLGGLTAMMSRLVGPRGLVFSFEASPRIFEHLQHNVVSQGFANVTTIPRAVYSRSGARLRIVHGDHLNDSLYGPEDAGPDRCAYVESVSLDDFVEWLGAPPDLIKMDVEGAEFDCVVGGSLVIGQHRPHLILEQQTDDSRCLDFLRQRGYVAIDLNTLREVRSVADYPEGVGLRNLLCVHSDRLGALPYRLPAERAPVLELGKADFRTDGIRTCAGPFRVVPGRYFLDMAFSASGTDLDLICGVELDGEVRLRYHGYPRLLADSYRDWVLDVDRECNLQCFFEFPGGRDPTFVLDGGLVTRLAEFEPVRGASILLR